jgi:probable rRNA maturation factor
MGPEAGPSSRSIYLGPWRIDVTTRPGVPRLVPLIGLARAIGVALESADAPQPASIGLILADDPELASLNVVHLGKDGATDVLSFPLLPASAFPSHQEASPPRNAGTSGVVPFALPPGRRLHLGDIVVSVERAIEQAEAGRGGQTGDVRWSPADELRLLVTHGTLHICGWDHAEPAEEAAMRALEQRLLVAR